MRHQHSSCRAERGTHVAYPGLTIFTDIGLQPQRTAATASADAEKRHTPHHPTASTLQDFMSTHLWRLLSLRARRLEVGLAAKGS